jgi:hypothetical protein
MRFSSRSAATGAALDAARGGAHGADPARRPPNSALLVPLAGRIAVACAKDPAARILGARSCMARSLQVFSP